MALTQAQRDALAGVVERTLLSSQARTALKDLLLDLEPYLSTGGGGALTDGDYGDVTVSGSGTVMTVTRPAMTQFTVTLPFTRKTEHRVTVAYVGMAPTDRLMVGWGAVADTDENGPDADIVTFSATAQTNQFSLLIASRDPIGGTLKLSAMVA